MNRREFLVGAVSAGFAGAALAESKSAVPAAGRMLFGACRGIDDVPLMKSIGYDFWEWSTAIAFIPEKDDEAWKRQRERILSTALPLRAVSGFLPGKFRLTGPEANFEPALKYAETVLRRAEEVDLKAVVFGSGSARNVPGDFMGKKRPDLEKGVEQYADFCRELCKRVSDLKKVVIVIEPLRPNESNIVNYVWQGLQICEDVNSPRLAQLADIYHMSMGRESAESIVRAGARLRHCHVATHGSRLYPGAKPELVARLKPYFDALKAIGYTDGVSCECGWGDKKHLAKNLETALKTMKGLI